jgi:hypothetical protein
MFRTNITMFLGCVTEHEVYKRRKLYNIPIGINVAVTVFIDTKHYGLKQCNDRAVLAIES